MDTLLTLELTADQTGVLIESLTWSLNATERTLINSSTPAKLEKWGHLDDIMAQLQVAKRELLLGEGQ